MGAAVGLIASFLETVEYQILLKNSHAVLTCNLNSVFSCTNVLNAWQSKVFGFPNSMMCMVFFTLMLGLGLVGWTGGSLSRGLRLTAQGIALFFLGFGLWFLEQSTFSVRALCILCVFCFAGLLTVNGSFLRLNVADLPIGQARREWLRRRMTNGSDIFGWIVFGLLITFVIVLKFR
jgi:uncharacterized membrane protein